WRPGSSKNARVLGERLRSRLEPLEGSRGITEVRTVGRWAGVHLAPAVLSGRQAAEGLAQRGVLAKETHDITIRFAPPLIITEEELDWMLDQFGAGRDAATAPHKSRQPASKRSLSICGSPRPSAPSGPVA